METKENSRKGGSIYSPLANAPEPSTVPDQPSVVAKGEAMDTEEISDNDGELATHIASDENIEDIVGFSIGKEQLRMKSPDTPAFEKAKALDQSKDYFDLAPEDGDVHDGDAVSGTYYEYEERPITVGYLPDMSGSPERQTSPVDPSRSRTAKEILRDGFDPRTRRSSSGSTGMVDTLKKLLPDLPSISLPKAPSLSTFGFGSKSKGESLLNRAKRSSTLFSRGVSPWTSSTLPPDRSITSVGRAEIPATDSTNSPASQLAGNDCGGSKGANDNSISDPHAWDLLSQQVTPNRRSLRRATSENSLFMRNDLQRTTTLDDAEKWGDVSEQINSRFKAITDSLQDSAIIRLPKMPSVSLGPFKTSLERSNSDIARLNADRNMVITQPDAMSSGFGVRKKPFPPPDKQKKHSHPILNHAVSDLDGDVVILGGYRGSVLRSAKPPNKQLWVPVKVGINLRRVNLEVGLNPDEEESMTDSIIPSGVLSHIGPIDICRRLLRKLTKSSHTRPDQLRIHDYGYDWRLSPQLLSRRLIEFLESLECNRDGTTGRSRGAVVIAHSLGGLITRHAVNQRPDLFAGVIYAGVPQHCVNILGPLRNGDDVLLSSRVLTAQVNFTLRTSYLLLPESGRCFINKTTGERYDVDFFDVKTWEEYCLSPCVANSTPKARPEQRKSIIDTLSDSLPSLALTGKRNSIIQRNCPPGPEPQSAFGDAEDAVKEVAGTAAQRAGDAFTASNKQPLEPSMDSTSSPAHRESVATACNIPREEALAYLDRTLKAVRHFKQELAFQHSHQASDAYPPIAVMYGNNVPTVFGARVESREAIKHSDVFQNLAFAAGDGVVLARSARPPEGYKIVKGGLVRSERGHIGLLGDLEGVGKCLRAIMDARKKGVGTGTFAQKGAGNEASPSS